MRKPAILTTVACYLPGYKYGGPVRTIANMVDQLGDELDFLIVTADRDALDTEPYQDVDTDDWNTVGQAKVFYTSPGRRSLGSLARLINETTHDILYLNSFFNPVFTLQPLLARRFGLIPKRPTVLATRGEFSAGALGLKSWKKVPYVFIAGGLGLYGGLTWQASSDFEAEQIRGVMGKVAKQIVVAPDLSVLPGTVTEEKQERARDTGEPLRVCFLSRIVPMKNTDYALRVLAEVEVPVEFNIYGVIADESYWQLCQEIVKRLPAHVIVRYHGVIDHADVAQVLAKHDLFFLPTRGENYGHVIFEAMAAGVPVLISDQTPWRDLETFGVGWDLPLNNKREFRAVLEAQAKIGGEIRVALRQRTKEYARRIAEDKNVLIKNLNMFQELTINE